jgi:hypothetical protein
VRRAVLVLAGPAVLVLAGGFAYFAFAGQDAPPPPRLSPRTVTIGGDRVTIETNRYPDARFALDRPFSLAVSIRSQRTRRGVELVGSAPIAFPDFLIEPPSVAGLVTVRDHGRLEFRLVLAPA